MLLIILVQGFCPLRNKITVFPRIIAGGDSFLFAPKGLIIQGKVTIRERRLFQIFLIGGRALNILSFYSTVQK